jgi:hypothetical protein
MLAPWLWPNTPYGTRGTPVIPSISAGCWSWDVPGTAARVAGISLDVLRVFDGVASQDMYSDPLGTLLSRLRGLLGRKPQLSGLRDFVEKLEVARLGRNDLLHALPVLHGIHRRETKDLARVRNFFDVEDLRVAVGLLDEAGRIGNQVLYHDGGAAVEAWYAAQSS